MPTSRRTKPPTWPELVTRAAVADVATARGVFRRTGSGSQGWFSSAKPLRIAVVPTDTDVRLAYRRRGRWRLETDAGFLHVTDGPRAFLRDEGEPTVASAPADLVVLLAGPDRLLLPELEPRMGFGRPPTVAEIEPDECAGRRAWRARTPDGTVWVDDLTGVVLRQEEAGGSVVGFVELDLDGPVTDAEVTYDGPSEPVPVPEPVPRQRTAVTAAPESVATLSWWPDGVGLRLLSGDPATGAVVASVEVARRSAVWFSRAPLVGDGPEVRAGAVVRWSTSRWRYALSADDRDEVDEALLHRVRAGLGE